MALHGAGEIEDEGRRGKEAFNGDDALAHPGTVLCVRHADQVCPLYR